MKEGLPLLSDLAFVDVEAPATRALLRRELGELPAFYGYTDLIAG
jgi:hypothetical protein